VQLSAARVEQVALAQTGKDTAKALTDQEKAAARVSIIFRDTAKAQGDFARTSEGLANQQRILAARTADLEANLGRLLLPTVNRLTGDLADAADTASTLVDELVALGKVQIPPIKIPLVIDQQQGEGFGFGDLIDPAKKATLAGLRTMFPGLDAILKGQELLNQLNKETADTSELAAQFAEIIGGYYSNAIEKGMPKVKIKAPTGGKGFGAGLTPQDLFGPLIKAIPQRLQEALLDAKIAGKGERAVLVQILETMTEALDDPRLKAKGRIAIKQIIESVKGQITAIDKAVADGIAKGKADAQADRDKAAADAREAAAEQRAGFDLVIDSLSLQMDKADLTASFTDNKKIAIAIEKAILEQIKIEGRTPELLRQLFEIRQESRQIVSDEATARQFRQLGLGPTGEAFIPKPENLRKQFEQLGEVEGLGKQIGSKLARQFELVGKLLRDPTEKLTKETREWIRDFFKTIRGELDTESRKPLLPRHVQISEDILTALGLGKDPDFARIRGAVPKLPTARLAPPTASTATGGTPVNINGDITVVADNPDAFLRELQKTAGRTAGTSRGRFPGRSLGLG
jgi:hypothetical protein